MFDDSQRPLLSPHLQLQDSIALVALSAAGIEARFTGAAADVLRKTMPRMIGELNVGEIRRAVGLSKQGFAELFGEIAKHGYIIDVSVVTDGNEVERQLDGYFRICDSWGAEIFEAPFWRIFLSGNASESQVLGWATEFYHRTLGADEHNLIASQRCQYEEMSHGLREHYEEELGHGRIFKRALQSCGLAGEDFQAPLPATQRLISYMSELGRRDGWAYLGCYGILHSPRAGQTAEAASRQFETFSRMYPASKPIFDAFLEHTLLDLQLDHNQIFLESLVRDRNNWSAEEARRALRGAWGMTKVFSSFFDAILQHY